MTKVPKTKLCNGSSDSDKHKIANARGEGVTSCLVHPPPTSAPILNFSVKAAI